VKADSLKVLQKGMVSESAAHLITDKVKIDLSSKENKVILKNELMILDLVSNNDWNRPIYYAVTVGSDNYAGMQFHPERSAKVGTRLLQNFVDWQL